MDEFTRIDAPLAAPPARAPIRPAVSRPDPRKAEFEANKLQKRLRRQVGEAIGEYALIAPNDRVMVCVSGGKDSYGLLDILWALKGRAPFPFEVIAVNLDQKQPGFPADVLPRYLDERRIPFRIVEQDTYSVVKRVIPEGATMCSLCSRLRRGALYRVASEIGATKIALGHHRDDLLATFFLNLFFGGKLKTMPPKLVSDDGRHVVIRPLVNVRERDLARFAALRDFPIIPCNLCGSQEHLQRRQVGLMLREWEKKHPGRIESICNALGNVVPSHLMDRALFDFNNVAATGRDEAGGDIAFDVDPVLERATDGAAADTGDSAVPVTFLRAGRDGD
ncbi:MAG: tRNA 2-thiocytidine(32) synthetase TtcA [Betaproteobacteria bacterium]